MRQSRAFLENELAGLAGSGRDAHIAVRYYGFDGQGGRTLEAAGHEVGLTKERVRQIVAIALRRLSAGQTATPVLDRVIIFVAGHMPADAGEIEAKLLSAGLTGILFRLEGVVGAAEMLRKPLPFRITEVGGRRVVHARQDRDSVRRVIRVARRNIRHWGMSTVSRIAQDAFRLRTGVGRDLVSDILADLAGFHWLDEAHEWFWISNVPGNRVLARIAKILCVAGPIGVADLRAGIARDYKMHDWVPPDAVLLQLCRQIQGVRVSSSRIKAEPAITPDEALSKIERDIVRVLVQNGGYMARSAFMETFLRQGFKHVTLYAQLSYSPIMSTSPRGYCGLIGTSARH